jgi:hypothetical protein
MKRHRTGRFAPSMPVAAQVPLLMPVLCARISRGNRTRAANHRRKVMAVMAMLQLEMGMTK